MFKTNAANSKLHIFTLTQKEQIITTKNDIVSWDFKLPPYGCALLIAVPENHNADKLLSHIRHGFNKVKATLIEKDPFSAENLPETKTINGYSGGHLIDSAVVIGARRNRTFDRIDYVSYAMLYPGTVDFGAISPSEMELELACGTPQGGMIRIFADGINPENQIAEIKLSPDFRTADWNTFEKYSTDIKKSLTGKHKIIISVEGLGFVNLKHWKFKQVKK
jgi:hypothetical protein